MSESERKLPRLLDDLALGLLLGHILIRLLVSAGDKTPATNLAIHLLAWPPLCIWALKGLLEGRLTLRITGVEVPILIWSAVCVYSIFQAPYKLPAIETAGAFVSMAALVPAIVNIASRFDVARLMHAVAAGIAVYALLQSLVILPMMRNDPDVQAKAAANEAFKIRLHSNEPWGTFLQPNSLAGFLVLMIPWIAGALADSIRTKARYALGAALAVCIAAISLTGSKGGWVALAAALGAGGVLAYAKGRRAILVAGAIAGLALGIGGWVVTSRSVTSMQFRAAYADAAIKAGMTSPAFGIGLGNFEDAYPQYKGELQEETRKVHNDYVQVFCELGIAGLLAFLAMLGWGLKAAVAPIPAQEQASLPWRALSIAALSALLGAAGLSGEIMLPLCVLVPAAIVYAFGNERGPLSRIGLAAGFIGLLVHLAVDFDLYEYGVGTALFVALALLLEGVAVTARRGAAVTLALASLAVAVPLGYAAKVLQPGAAESWRLYTISMEGSKQEPSIWISLENPLDPDGALAAADAFRNDAMHSKALERDLGTALRPWFEALQLAIAIRPNFAPYHYRAAMDHELAARLLRDRASKLGGQSAMLSAMIEEQVSRAEAEYRRAVELYPTRAHGRAGLARFLAANRKADEAKPHAQAALKYSAMPTDSPHLRLDDATKAEMEAIAR